MTIRWGIVSAGKISHDFVNAINSYPDKGDQIVAAVAARDVSRAKEFANLHNIAKVFDSYKAMAESDDIDVAYIGAINPDHHRLTKLFLENNKHVLCEKPLCLNLKQTQNLVNLATSKNLFLMEAIWSRFAPSYIALEEIIRSGLIGEVRFVEVNFGEAMEDVERIIKKSLGGGVILDLGVYVLQFAQLVFKEEPIKVTSTGELNEDGVDMVNTIILEYTGGRRAVLNNHAKVNLWNKATVCGTKGRVTLEEPFHFATVLTDKDGQQRKFPLHSSNLPYNFENGAGMIYEAMEVKRCIENGLLESPRVPHKESILLAKLQDTVRQQLGVHFDEDDEIYS